MVVVVLQPLSCIPVGQPHGLCPTRLLCPRDASGKNTGVGCHFSTPWHLPNPGIEIASLVSPVSQVDSLLSEPSGKPPPKKNYGNSETKETSSWNLFILETIYGWENIPRLFTCMPRWMMVSFTEKENTEGKSLEITLFWTMTLISLGIRNWNCTKNNEKHNSIGWRYKLNNHRSVQSLSCVWLFVTP